MHLPSSAIIRNELHVFPFNESETSLRINLRVSDTNLGGVLQ